MFRLIKLAIYAFIGYALYELYQGMTAPRPSARRGSTGGGGSAGEGSAGGRGESRDSAHNLTGAGTGRTEQTLDSDGGSIRHHVGRGVTTR